MDEFNEFIEDTETSSAFVSLKISVNSLKVVMRFVLEV